MTELPTLTKRKLQAQVIGPVYAEMAEQLGEVRAGEILDAAIRKAAIAEGKSRIYPLDVCYNNPYIKIIGD